MDGVTNLVPEINFTCSGVLRFTIGLLTKHPDAGYGDALLFRLTLSQPQVQSSFLVLGKIIPLKQKTHLHYTETENPTNLYNNVFSLNGKGNERNKELLSPSNDRSETKINVGDNYDASCLPQ